MDINKKIIIVLSIKHEYITPIDLLLIRLFKLNASLL